MGWTPCHDTQRALSFAKTRGPAASLPNPRQRMGVGFVVETARCRCPDRVAILKVADLKLSLPLALVWRKDNLSPLLSRFVTDVGSLVKRRPTTRQDGQF